jgi:hypothetical protein
MEMTNGYFGIILENDKNASNISLKGKKGKSILK